MNNMLGMLKMTASLSKLPLDSARVRKYAIWNATEAPDVVVNAGFKPNRTKLKAYRMFSMVMCAAPTLPPEDRTGDDIGDTQQR